MPVSAVPDMNSPEYRAKVERVDRGWLRAAMVFGLTNSKDPERRLGACVVSPGNMKVSFGYNGFPMGLPDTVENWADKEFKNAVVKHAEENAIAKAPFDTIHSTLYVTLKPCHQCLGTAANGQIRRVVWLDDPVKWRYENERAFTEVLRHSGMQAVVYPFTIIESGILELFGAAPTGYSSYCMEDNER